MILKEAEALKGKKVRFIEKSGRETEMTVRHVSPLLQTSSAEDVTFIAYADMNHPPKRAIHLYVRPGTEVVILEEEKRS